MMGGSSWRWTRAELVVGSRVMSRRRVIWRVGGHGILLFCDVPNDTLFNKKKRDQTRLCRRAKSVTRKSPWYVVGTRRKGNRRS